VPAAHSVVLSATRGFIRDSLTRPRPQANKVDYIFLVGGFAESKLLLQRVRASFEQAGRRVVTPSRPGLAVLRGAVLLGLGAADRFVSRIARFSYGVRILEPFAPANPDHSGRATCKVAYRGVPATMVCGVFSLIVRKGVSIKTDEARQSAAMHCTDDAREVEFEFFATPLAAVKWTADAGMTRLGRVVLPATKEDSLHVELAFGKTEMLAVAVNGRTGERRRVAIDYGFRAT
jgi:molecular chaperone DnaK (HSP70)